MINYHDTYHHQSTTAGSHALAPAGIVPGLHVHRYGAVAVQWLVAGPRDRPQHAGPQFHLRTKIHLAGVTARQEKRGEPHATPMRVPGIQRAAQPDLSIGTLDMQP